MYSLLVCGALALVIAVGGAVLQLWGWLGAILIALLVFVVSWILVARRMARRLQPQMQRVRKLAEVGHLDAAVEALEDLLPMGRWIPMLTGQLHAQIGTLAHYAGKEDKAMRHLAQASRRAAEAQLVLACTHFRKGEGSRALAVLAAAAPLNREHALFQNVYAYLLQKEQGVDAAIAQLNRFVQKAPNNEIGKENLLRLQNGRKLDMKQFGTEWYALGLERPPASMGQLRGRKGFRQPPKRRGS